MGCDKHCSHVTFWSQRNCNTCRERTHTLASKLDATSLAAPFLREKQILDLTPSASLALSFKASPSAMDFPQHSKDPTLSHPITVAIIPLHAAPAVATLKGVPPLKPDQLQHLPFESRNTDAVAEQSTAWDSLFIAKPTPFAGPLDASGVGYKKGRKSIVTPQQDLMILHEVSVKKSHIANFGQKGAKFEEITQGLVATGVLKADLEDKSLKDR